MGVRRIGVTRTVLVICLVASGCTKQPPQPSGNSSVEATEQIRSVPAPVAPRIDEPVGEPHSPTPVKDDVPAAKPSSADAQMLDDADASGMTARPAQDHEDAPGDETGAGNETDR